MSDFSFSMTSRVIVPLKEPNLAAGAQVVFEGIVRNHNAQKEVLSLEYEAYEPLCIKEGEKILLETKNMFQTLSIRVIHRIGSLKLGETAVWISVLSAHRDEAFRACRYIIDEIKARLPIWKKEYYANGEQEWVNCKHNSCQNEIETDLFSKQVILPNFGQSAQSRLKKAKVLVVGAGALGTAALTYLARSGVNKLTVCDGDLLEVTNLHRQILYTFNDIGKSKAKLAKYSLENILPNIEVEAIIENFQGSNALSLLSNKDLVLDCTDDFSTKLLLNETCQKLKIPLVYSSVYQLEGMIAAVLPDKLGQCLNCLWQNLNPVNAAVCSQTGVLGAVTGVFGSLQALEAIKYLIGWKTELSEKVVFLDLQSLRLNAIRVTKNKNCSLCGNSSSKQEKELNRENYTCESKISDLEISVADLSSSKFSNSYMIDLRENFELLETEDLPGHLNVKKMPLSKINRSEFISSKANNTYIFICQRGVRSLHLVQDLYASGCKNVFSLRGGASALKEGLANGCSCR